MPHIRKHADDTPFLSEINMIPMIDVALVLLIIMMVITPQLVLNSIKVRLPRSASEARPPVKTLAVAVRSNGDIYLNNEPVSEKALTGKIRAMPPASIQGALIYSDRDVPVERVVSVIDRVEAAGVRDINLSTERRRE